MNKKKGHYYLSCVTIAKTGYENKLPKSTLWPRIENAVLILGHIADRLGDLVLAIEEHTRATTYPDIEP